jgi:hypothetical protein
MGDRSGWRKLEFWWEAGKALVRGERAEDSALSGHAELKSATSCSAG